MRAFFLFILFGLGPLHAAAPVVSNISAAQRANSRLVDITYDVAADFPTVSVSLQVSSDGGSTFTVPATTLSGAIGAGVTPGKAKKITWDAGNDWSGQYSTQMCFKVIADDVISGIADQTILMDSNTGPLIIYLDDRLRAAGPLYLNGTSSNTTLVPNANIVFDAKGNGPTVKVTPASGQSGMTIIKVTARAVSDESVTSSYSFVVTVDKTLALIPTGSFIMGDSLDDMSDAPTHKVTLDAFYIGRCEVTKAEWQSVQTWAVSNGYSDLSTGSGKSGNHPVQTVSWYQVVKWCNARSQKEGLTPVYYTNDAQTTIYKTGDVNVTNAQVKWTANGYRLPTEAEWEKAARGGLSGKRFPWGDTISHSQANYLAVSRNSFDLSGSVNNYHPIYNTGNRPYTSPVGVFAANGYGLFDMAGNVEEWCWDWYGAYTQGELTNPLGDILGSTRVSRGGSWSDNPFRSASARRIEFFPSYAHQFIGFRVVRSKAP